MANIKSAVKRAKTAEIKRLNNRSTKSNIASVRASFFEAIGSRDKAKCEALFRTYASVLDKACKHGVIKANNASRRKGRAAAQLATL